MRGRQRSPRAMQNDNNPPPHTKKRTMPIVALQVNPQGGVGSALDNAYEPKPIVPEYPPDLRTIFRLRVVEFELKSSSLMLLVARKTEHL